MDPPQRRANIALGLYVIALCTPAIRLGADWMFGFAALALSFVGTFFDLDLKRGYRLACVLGVLANVLMVVSYFGIVLGEARQRRARKVTYLVTAVSAAVLTVGVLGPLRYSGELGAFAGYILWVIAAVMLV